MTETRFVVIGDVQYSRARAVRLGLIEAPAAEAEVKDGPARNKARTSGSAGKGKPVTATVTTAAVPPAAAAAGTTPPADPAAGSTPPADPAAGTASTEEATK